MKLNIFMYLFKSTYSSGFGLTARLLYILMKLNESSVVEGKKHWFLVDFTWHFHSSHAFLHMGLLTCLEFSGRRKRLKVWNYPFHFFRNSLWKYLRKLHSGSLMAMMVFAFTLRQYFFIMQWIQRMLTISMFFNAVWKSQFSHIMLV